MHFSQKTRKLERDSQQKKHLLNNTNVTSWNEDISINTFNFEKNVWQHYTYIDYSDKELLLNENDIDFYRGYVCHYRQQKTKQNQTSGFLGFYTI